MTDANTAPVLPEHVNGVQRENVPPTSIQRPPPRDRRQARMAEAFANIVGVLMRDPGFSDLKLADLEWLVLPAVLSGQWRLGQIRTNQPLPEKTAQVVPAAVALWATVSPEVDKRLSQNLDKPLLLRPHEWASGDIPWLIAAAGNARAVPRLLAQLERTEFKGKTAKMRVNDESGAVVVRSLSVRTGC